MVDSPAAAPVFDYASRHGLTITTIFNTHAHPDHIGINRELEGQKIHIVASQLLENVTPGVTQTVRNGERITFEGELGEVFLTEGHVDGHVSYLFDDFLFCGDTLFAGGCGYLFDGPPTKMHNSLMQLAALPSTTKVICAHEYTQDNLRFAYSLEPDNTKLISRIRRVWKKRGRGESTVPSTVQEERDTNPFLRFHSEELLDNLRKALPDEALNSERDIFTATRKLKDQKRYKEITDDQLPLSL